MYLNPQLKTRKKRLVKKFACVWNTKIVNEYSQSIMCFVWALTYFGGNVRTPFPQQSAVLVKLILISSQKVFCLVFAIVDRSRRLQVCSWCKNKQTEKNPMQFTTWQGGEDGVKKFGTFFAIGCNSPRSKIKVLKLLRGSEGFSGILEFYIDECCVAISK